MVVRLTLRVAQQEQGLLPTISMNGFLYPDPCIPFHSDNAQNSGSAPDFRNSSTGTQKKPPHGCYTTRAPHKITNKIIISVLYRSSARPGSSNAWVNSTTAVRQAGSWRSAVGETPSRPCIRTKRRWVRGLS